MTIAGIQARMGSTRFPGKCLNDLCGESVLQHVIERAKLLLVDKVILLTTENKEDDLIEAEGIKNNIEVMRDGFKPLQCLEWFRAVYRKYQPDNLIRICGDSPFFDVELAEKQMNAFQGGGYLYGSYIINNKPAILTKYGIFIEIFKGWYINQMKSITYFENEHVTPAFYTTMRNDCLFLPVPKDFYHDGKLIKFKTSIDYKEDLIEANKVCNELDDVNFRTLCEYYKDHEGIDDIDQKYKWNVNT